MARELELGMDTQPTTEAPAQEVDTSAAGAAAGVGEQAADTRADETQATTAETVDTEAAPDAEPKRVPLAALKEEREKRKRESERSRKLEEELAYLRGQLEAGSRQAQPKAKEPTKEEIEAQFFADPVSYVQRLKDEAVDAARHQLAVTRAQESEERARRNFSDFDEVMAEFQAEFYKAPPQLKERVVANLKEQSDPAAFVYNQIKMNRQIRDSGGSIEQMRANIEKQVREEYERKSKQAGASAAAEAIPKTKVGAPGAGARSAQQRSTSKWDDMFSRKPF